MEAIGLLETKGLVLAIEALDIMLKSANVSLLKKEIVGGGLVTIVISGSVSDVKTAIDVGVASCKRKGFSVYSLVIPRCSEEAYNLLKPASPIQNAPIVAEESLEFLVFQDNELSSSGDFQTSLESQNIIYTEDELLSLTVKQLRKIYSEANIDSSKKVMSMSKKALIKEILKNINNN